MKKIFILIFIQIVVFSCAINKNTREFTFTYNVELSSSNGKKIELWIPVPQSNEVQEISNFIISAEDLNVEIKDEMTHGNKYAYIYSLNGTSSSKIVSMTFDVKRIEHNNVNYHDVNPNSYLGSSSMVPIGSIFASIIEKNNLNNNNMKDVYDFVLSGMHYGKPKSKDNEYYNNPWLSADGEYGMKKVSRDKVVSLYETAKNTKGSYTFGNGNSIYACDIGVGNCTDYHSYFMSLSRTIEVPSRFHMGFSIPNGDEGKVGGYHCWADYYVDGEGWYPVDISEADKDSERSEYFFGTVCNNRVEMMVGRDFELDGYNQKSVNLFIYPLLEIADEKSTSFKKSFSYKNLY